MPTKLSFLSIDSILLLVLCSAHLWFSQVSSAILVVMLAAYIGLDFFLPLLVDEVLLPGRRERIAFLGRLTIVFFAVAFAAILPVGHAIIQRLQEGPATNAGDSLIQTEVAIAFLLAGQNPYSEDYNDTVLADWKGGEPPFTPIPGILHHNVYLPFLFIASIPAYLLGQALLGWYDQRLLYVMIYLVTLLLITQLVRRKRHQLMLLILVGLNFLFVFFLMEGRNDVMILFGVVLTTLLLAGGRPKIAAFVLGLTLMIKHQAWFFVPFYLYYSWLREPIETRTVGRWLISFWPLVTAVTILVVPFLMWDAPSFFEDTIGYITGSSPYSFPIRGIGFSHLMVAFGFLPSYEASFPFLIPSLLLGIPVLFYGWRRQWHENSLSNLWLGFSLFSFAFQFFSRFFNDNYLIFIIQTLLIAAFLDVDKAGTIRTDGEGDAEESADFVNVSRIGGSKASIPL